MAIMPLKRTQPSRPDPYTSKPSNNPDIFGSPDKPTDLSMDIPSIQDIAAKGFAFNDPISTAPNSSGGILARTPQPLKDKMAAPAAPSQEPDAQPETQLPPLKKFIGGTPKSLEEDPRRSRPYPNAVNPKTNVVSDKNNHRASFRIAAAQEAANEARLPEWLGGQNSVEMLNAATASISEIFAGRDMSDPAAMRDAVNQVIESYNLRRSEAVGFRNALMLMLMSNPEITESVNERADIDRKIGIVRGMNDPAGGPLVLDPRNKEHIELSKRMSSYKFQWMNVNDLIDKPETEVTDDGLRQPKSKLTQAQSAEVANAADSKGYKDQQAHNQALATKRIMSRDNKFKALVEGGEYEMTPESYAKYRDQNASARASENVDKMNSQVLGRDKGGQEITMEMVKALQKKNTDDGLVGRGKRFDNSVAANRRRLENEDYGGAQGQMLLSQNEIQYLAAQSQDSIMVMQNLDAEIKKLSYMLGDDDGVPRATPDEQKQIKDEIARLGDQRAAETLRFKEIRDGVQSINDWRTNMLTGGMESRDTKPWQVFSKEDYQRPAESEYYKTLGRPEVDGSPSPKPEPKITFEDLEKNAIATNDPKHDNEKTVQDLTKANELRQQKYAEYESTLAQANQRLAALTQDRDAAHADRANKDYTYADYERLIKAEEQNIASITKNMDAIQSGIAKNQAAIDSGGADQRAAIARMPDFGKTSDIKEALSNSKSPDELEIAMRGLMYDYEQLFGKKGANQTEGGRPTIELKGNHPQMEALKKWLEWVDTAKKSLGKTTWEEFKKEANKK